MKNLESGLGVTPSTAVIEAIAEYEGVDPLDLKQPLHDVIDTDALDALIGDGGVDMDPPDVVVQFSYDGREVHVSSDGTVEVS